MSIDDLLIERYKVIARYPHCPYKVGDIIEPKDGRFVLTQTSHRDEFGETVFTEHMHPIETAKDYPNLFQPLPWWEERKPEEMPQFLKWINNKTVTQPKRYSDQFFYLEDDNSFGYFLGYTEPATEAEYTAYIIKTQQP